MRKKLVIVFIIGLVCGILLSRGFLWFYKYYSLREAMKKDPVVRHILKAEELRKKGKTEECIKEYKEALAFRPNDPVLLEYLADAYIESGDYEGAIKIFKKIGEKGDSFALYRLGEIYWRIGRVKEALKVLNKSKEMGNPLAEIKIEIIKSETKRAGECK